MSNLSSSLSEMVGLRNCRSQFLVSPRQQCCVKILVTRFMVRRMMVSDESFLFCEMLWLFSGICGFSYADIISIASHLLAISSVAESIWCQKKREKYKYLPSFPVQCFFIAHFIFSFFVTFLDYKNFVQTHKLNSPYRSLSSLTHR